MALEALRTQLDTLRLENQQLEVENARLRDSHPDEAALVDTEAALAQCRAEHERLSTEYGQLQELHEQLLRDVQEERAARAEEGERESSTAVASDARSAELQRELESQSARCQELEENHHRLQAEAERQRTDAELERYRAVDAERRKWEIREERLAKQVQDLQRRSEELEATIARDRPDRDDELARTSEEIPRTVTFRSAGEVGTGASSRVTEGGHRSSDESTSLLADGGHRDDGGEGGGDRESSSDVHGRDRGRAEIENTSQDAMQSLLPAALLAQQLPPLAKFSGQTAQAADGETIQDWLDQFEMVATMYHWDQHAKLVNLATRLSGQAYAFYRSCTPQQRTSYDAMESALKKRFMPVRIKAVQSSLFHDRKQGPKETVDSYAQSLRALFYRAYPHTTQGSSEAETMGQSVLTYQFVAGLRPEIKAKVVGSDGDFEELLVKARFQEAKIRDLADSAASANMPSTKASTPSGHSNPAQRAGHGMLALRDRDRRSLPDRGSSTPIGGAKCYHCGSQGHLIRQCPHRGKGGQRETPGRGHPPIREDRRVANLVPAQGGQTLESTRETTAELRRRLQAAEVSDALTEAAATMHVITPGKVREDARLGPTPTAKVELEGNPVVALLDTGSPVTIVSLKFLVETLAKQRQKEQSPSDWRAMVEERLEEPTVTLQNYGGMRLNIVRQLKASITRPGHSVSAVIQVQKDAPAELLLGTDLLPKLGFHFVQSQPEGEDIDLLTQLPPSRAEGEESSARSLQQPTAKTPTEESPTHAQGVVRLIQATRLPAQHMKLLRAKVEGFREHSLAVFEPELEMLKGKGLTMAEAATIPDADNCVTLIVENRGFQPTRLKKGQVLGRVQSASIHSASETECGPEDGEPRETVGAVRTAVPQSSEELASSTPDGESLQEQKQRLLEVLHLDPSNLTEKQRERMEAFLLDQTDLFALSPLELGCTNLTTHSIDTGDHLPIRQHARRTPFALRHKIDEMVEKMTEQGVIQPSRSPWASPVVLVEKKDRTLRFCIDYRRLNAITKMDVFPLPRIDDTLDLLSHSQYFTTLDLASGYWQVRMHPESREKTAFTTYSGLYEFLVMPFGLCNAPATFQRLMETVLAGLARDACMVYMDDILVIGKTYEEHLDNLRRVLDRLREAGLKLKPEKCSFGKGEVAYLGYVVSKDGLSPDPGKIKAIQEFPQPLDLKSLRSFLGLATYYRRFIPQFSVVASPLHALTRKNASFVWDPVCEKAFCHLKTLLTTAPVLAFPDFTRDFLLETDASGLGLGAVLAQKQEDGTTRPVAFASRTLQAHEQNYGVTELEALGVVWAVKHFRHYLYGHHCDVFTDHEALKSLLNTPHPSGKLARWGMALQELDLTILYRPGKRNSNADALSRFPLASEERGISRPFGIVAATSVPLPSAKSGEATLETRQRQDPELQPIMDFLEDGVLPEEEKQARELILSRSQYQMIDGVLYHLEQDKTLRIIPPVADREKLFHEVHDGPFGAHLKDAKIHGELGRHYWWKGMRADIIRWCRACLTCATRQVGQASKPPLTPIPVSGPFDRVGVDIIKFPRSYSGNQYAVVFVDYLTKWPEVFPTSDQTALTIAKLLVEEVISRHGVPAELLSDRGAAFLSTLVREMCELMGIHRLNTTAYHPQTDGLVERFNRTLTNMLSKRVERNGKDWEAQLPFVLFAYRASLQESTRESPFFLMYGRDPRLPTELAMEPAKTRSFVDLDTYKGQVVSGLSEAWELARVHVKRAQKSQKAQYDRRTKVPKFSVGDRVFVLMPGAKSGKAYKFARPFHGPYRITAQYETGVEVRPVDRPQAQPIRVAFNRVCRCPEGIPDTYWPGKTRPGPQPVVEEDSEESDASDEEPLPEPTDCERDKDPVAESVWSGRLRSHQRSDEDALTKSGDM